MQQGKVLVRQLRLQFQQGMQLRKGMSMPTRVERFGTVVIGGGQAGLAVGKFLADREIDFTILSNEARAGDNWRHRWDSLRLFTPARYSGLPGMPFPSTPEYLADKDEVADYLQRYAMRFDLPIRLDSNATALTHDGSHFQVCVAGHTSIVEADSVVVATGAFHLPYVPVTSTTLSNAIHQVHSSRYRNPFELPDGPVLVVGAGNSGAQIALELSKYRKVWLSGRNTGHIPRRLLGRDVFDWGWPVMNWAHSETRAGRFIRPRAQKGGDALIGIPERELKSAGVIRVGRVTDERGGLPVCGDTVLEPRVIIWCTGYRHDFTWIDLPVFDASGTPVHVRGVSANIPGLFFMGLPFQHRMNSSLLGGVGADAEYIAAQVVRHSYARFAIEV